MPTLEEDFVADEPAKVNRSLDEDFTPDTLDAAFIPDPPTKQREPGLLERGLSTYGEAMRKSALPTAGVPAVTVPRFGKEGTWQRGVSEGLSGLAEGATTPEGIAMLGLTPVPGVGPAIGAGMVGLGTQAASQIAGEASVTGNPQTIAEAATIGAVTALPFLHKAREKYLLRGAPKDPLPSPDEVARKNMRPLPAEPDKPVLLPLAERAVEQIPAAEKTAPPPGVVAEPSTLVKLPEADTLTPEISAKEVTQPNEKENQVQEKELQVNNDLPPEPSAGSEVSSGAPVNETAPAGQVEPAGATAESKPKQKGIERPWDIIDEIKNSVGTIRRKSAAKPGSEGYYTDEFHALSKSGASRELFGPEGDSPDQTLDTLKSSGFLGKDATVADMEEAISRANAQRRAIATGQTPEIQDAKFQTALAKQKAKKSSETISVGDLGKGDKFTVGGEELEVVSINEDTGEVTVKDGRKFGSQKIPDGADLPIEKGSLSQVKQSTEFLPDEPSGPAPTKPTGPKLARGQNQGDLIDSTQSEDFALVGEKGTDADRVAAEKAKAVQDAAEAKAIADKAQTDMFKGMGGATPSEFTDPGTIVSNMFAAIDRDRAELGKPPMEPGQPRTWEQERQRAVSVMNRDPEWATDLIADVIKHPRVLEPWEHVGLVIQKEYWKAEANNALKRLGQAVADGRDVDIVEAKASAARFEDKLAQMEKAVGRGGSGSEAGRRLQAQKFGLTDDLTIVEMRLQARAKVGMRELTESESKEIAALHEKYQKALTEEKEKAATSDQRRSEEAAKATAAQIERDAALAKVPQPHIQKIIDRVRVAIRTGADEARARLKGKLFTIGDPEVLLDLARVGADNIWTIGEDFAKWSVNMAEDIGEHVKPHLAQIWEASKKLINDLADRESGIKTPTGKKAASTVKATIRKGDSPSQKQEKLTGRIKERIDSKEEKSITPLVQRLARAMVEGGIRGRDELIDAVHSVIAGLKHDWTRRDTMDAISGYGDYKNLSKDEVSLALRDLKGQMQQVAKLEDMAAKQPPLRTGIERREPTAVEKKLIALVNEAKRKGGYETTDPERQLRSALEEMKKKTSTQIADYERRVREDDFSVRKLDPVKPDAELVRAQFRLQQIKKAWETKKKAMEYANRSWWEKEFDRAASLRRFNVLSGPMTLVKLLAYSITSPITKFASELAGKGLKTVPLFRELAKQAPSEGETSVRTFATAYSKALTLGMKDAWQALRTHQSELHTLYDPRAPEPFHWTQFNGLLHEIEKSPLRRAAFEHSVAKRMAAAVREGVDVADLGVETAIKYAAYQDSNRALLLENNKLASAIRTGWRVLESKNTRTGKPSVIGKAAATLGRIEMPIISVPLNFAKQTMEAAMGLPVGAAKTVSAKWFGGLEKLKPEESDAIFRNLKNGSVGGAIALYAFLDGYYGWNAFGGYWEPGEKRKPTDAKFGSIRVLGWNVPRLLLHNPFVEAGQLANTMGRLMSPRAGAKQANPPAAVIAAGLGLMEHSPIGSEATEFSKMINGADHMSQINKHLADYFVPQLTRTVGDWTDPKKRNPKTFTDHLEMGFPVLRQQVAEKKSKTAPAVNP